MPESARCARLRSLKNVFSGLVIFIPAHRMSFRVKSQVICMGLLCMEYGYRIGLIGSVSRVAIDQHSGSKVSKAIAANVSR